MGVIGQLLRNDRNGAPISARNRAALKAALLSGTREKPVNVRWNAVQSFGVVGDKQDIPLLQKIADSYPDVGGVARKALERVRQRALNTIKISNRALHRETSSRVACCGMNRSREIFVSSGAGPDFRLPVEELSKQFYSPSFVILFRKTSISFLVCKSPFWQATSRPFS